MTHPFPTGVIYHLTASKANDGIHVETCGPNDYLVMVAEVDKGAQMISISRTQARFLVREWLDHINQMDELDRAMSEEEME